MTDRPAIGVARIMSVKVALAVNTTLTKVAAFCAARIEGRAVIVTVLVVSEDAT